MRALPDANFNRLHSFNWDLWRSTTVVPPPPAPQASLAERVGWVMGDPLPFLGGHSCMGEASKPFIEELLLHDSLNKTTGGVAVKRVAVGFADDVTAELYFPAAAFDSAYAGPPLQVVIVLPGIGFYNTGFSPGHCETHTTVVEPIPNVLASFHYMRLNRIRSTHSGF